ncbi:helix-turn-helix domain-containing protein [Pareuzebyella sediminis]|uniref:helix-turn-helix domain-containing protein n=1 Tax=Pareuzebyella sediminis TaxID=2607998 RepID=UPI0011EF5B7B|nr:helix-turn-helix transcriptional regulator [Pareuzebyella sediminis]
MVNTSDFIARLEYLLKYYDISASSFADKVGVQRSSISHLLSGRNKPSLEFVLKVIQKFPEVNLYWLLNGKGSFPQETKKKFTPMPKESPEQGELKERAEKPKKIQRIVIFYSDGSFEAYDED